MKKEIGYNTTKLSEWIRTHSLTDKQVEKLIAEKLERAKIHQMAIKKIIQKSA